MNANQLTMVCTGLTERVEALKIDVSDQQGWCDGIEARTHAAEVAVAVMTTRLEIETARAERTQSLLDGLERTSRETSLKLAVQENRTADALRRVEVVETRYWWLFTAIFVAILGLLATLIVALVKR